MVTEELKCIQSIAERGIGNRYLELSAKVFKRLFQSWIQVVALYNVCNSTSNAPQVLLIAAKAMNDFNCTLR